MSGSLRRIRRTSAATIRLRWGRFADWELPELAAPLLERWDDLDDEHGERVWRVIDLLCDARPERAEALLIFAVPRLFASLSEGDASEADARSRRAKRAWDGLTAAPYDDQAADVLQLTELTALPLAWKLPVIERLIDDGRFRWILLRASDPRGHSEAGAEVLARAAALRRRLSVGWLVGCLEEVRSRVTPPSVPPARVDWRAQPRSYPRGYRALVEGYGAGRFGGRLALLVPDRSAGALELEPAAARVRRWARQHLVSEESPGGRIVDRIDPDDLVMWGTWDGVALLWDAHDPDPELWPCLVAEDFGLLSHVAGSVEQLLVWFLDGEQPADILPACEPPPRLDPVGAALGVDAPPGLRRIFELAPPLERRTVPEIDWDEAAADVGAPLPSDYRAFVDLYGRNPSFHAGHMVDVLTPCNPYVFHDLRRTELMEIFGDDVARQASGRYGEHAGVIPCISTESRDLFWWVRVGDPNGWPLVRDGGGEIIELEGSFVDVLAEELEVHIDANPLTVPRCVR